ncbi:DUF4189 domain-containing protein [Lysobacter capsici]|nr:DUF4189 domain-containing protein [Lysobacter capsici]WND83242.1 DUF4189 domain-containing protein [Lysobacter capsici]WND88440.1 DUF4189 domain-containing protein [Lysobacter capsici]
MSYSAFAGKEQGKDKNSEAAAPTARNERPEDKQATPTITHHPRSLPNESANSHKDAIKKDQTMPKNKFLTLLACFVFCFQSAPALAEGMCPPGQYQTTPAGASGPIGCAPMPSNRAADNAWTPKWGGIARSKDNKTIGVSENADSETLAESLAIDDCKTLGGTGCTVENTYSNQCVAVAANQKISTHTDLEKPYKRRHQKPCRNAIKEIVINVSGFTTQAAAYLYKLASD